MGKIRRGPLREEFGGQRGVFGRHIGHNAQRSRTGGRTDANESGTLPNRFTTLSHSLNFATACGGEPPARPAGVFRAFYAIASGAGGPWPLPPAPVSAGGPVVEVPLLAGHEHAQFGFGVVDQLSADVYRQAVYGAGELERAGVVVGDRGVPEAGRGR